MCFVDSLCLGGLHGRIGIDVIQNTSVEGRQWLHRWPHTYCRLLIHFVWEAFMVTWILISSKTLVWKASNGYTNGHTDTTVCRFALFGDCQGLGDRQGLHKDWIHSVYFAQRPAMATPMATQVRPFVDSLCLEAIEGQTGAASTQFPLFGGHQWPHQWVTLVLRFVS